LEIVWKEDNRERAKKQTEEYGGFGSCSLYRIEERFGVSEKFQNSTGKGDIKSAQGKPPEKLVHEQGGPEDRIPGPIESAEQGEFADDEEILEKVQEAFFSLDHPNEKEGNEDRSHLAS
jgi:hypothetical protein